MTQPLMRIVYCGLFSSFFFFFFIFFSIDKDGKTLAVSNDPCYSDCGSDDESNYGSFNTEIYNDF